MTSRLQLHYPSAYTKLKTIHRTEQFFSWLGLDAKLVQYHINKPIYYPIRIPKKNSGFRQIQAPNEDLKEMQRKLNVLLQALYARIVPECSHAYIRSWKKAELRRDIVSNASCHLKKNHVLNLDIADFFASISACRIHNTLLSKEFSMPEELATIVALLCTYQKCLPAGAPSSPVLANMVCYQMDLALQKFCSESSIVYTRYADDMSFSCDHYLSIGTIDAIKKIILESGFTLNERKFRLTSSGRKQTVTGLVVNEKTNVDRKYIRRLRAMLYTWERAGISHAAEKHYQRKGDEELNKKFACKLRGMINFVGRVRSHDPLFFKLKERFCNLYPSKPHTE